LVLSKLRLQMRVGVIEGCVGVPQHLGGRLTPRPRDRLAGRLSRMLNFFEDLLRNS